MPEHETIKFINSFPDPTGTRFDRDQWLLDHGQANVILNCKAKNIYYPDHWTPLSLKCAFKGKEFYQSGKAIQYAGEDSFLIYNEGKEYSSFISSDTEVESFTINFSPNFVNHAMNAFFSKAEKNIDEPTGDPAKKMMPFFERAYPYDAGIRRQIFTIKQHTLAFEQHKEQINESLFSLLASLIQMQGSIKGEVENLEAVKKATREELYKRLYLVKDLIDAAYQDNITLETLSAAALINPCYLLRLFKSYFNITPHQYITARRIDAAKKLLLTGGLPVAEICNSVGFADLSSFSKLFKRETGLSPVKYAAINSGAKKSLRRD